MNPPVLTRFNPSVRRLKHLRPLLACLLVVSAAAQSERVVITSSPGYSITWDGSNGAFSDPEPGAVAPDNVAQASHGSVAFGSTAFIPGGVHDFPNVIDGFYGNSSSWISDFQIPDPDPFVGVAFGASVPIQSIAWSRDNGDDAERTPVGPYIDRAVGTYTLQVTRAADPAAAGETGDAATGWATIGTVQYLPGADNLGFSAYLRHRFDVAAGGQPIAATGLRIKVSDVGIDIDEIEVNPPADPEPPLSTLISVRGAPGYSIAWNGKNGRFSTSSSPAPAVKNRALASEGTTTFGSGELSSAGQFITNVIDGLYGNTHAWNSGAAAGASAYVGLNFGGPVSIKTIAWSRDNGDDAENNPAGPFTDHALGSYTLQITTVENPSSATAETGDASTGWADIGTIDLKNEGTLFVPHLRHAFSVNKAGAPITATGLRIKVSDPGIVIDEIEVNPLSAIDALSTGLAVITPQPGYTLKWDGNDGDYFGAGPATSAPQNDALAETGATAFGSGQIFPDGGIHDIDNVIDGTYGNSRSWISGVEQVDPAVDPEAGPFIGVAFGKTVQISSVAWSRDNGNNIEGQISDRWQGIYTLQITRTANPGPGTSETEDASTGWATVGSVEYAGQSAPEFNPWLRHRFDIAAEAGGPVAATGLRIKVSSGDIDIDEIEVNPSNLPPPALIVRASAPYDLIWDGNDGLFLDKASPARAPLNAASSVSGTTAFGSSEYGHGVHLISNVIDGQYGNGHSWIPDFTAAAPEATPFIGVRFGKSIPVRSIAWGRDNGDDSERDPAGPYTDRALGMYSVQFTTASNPGVTTPETGDPSTGWATVGTLDYKTDTSVFRSYVRHRFEVSSNGIPIMATGVRIKTPNIQAAIDELEVNPQESIRIQSSIGYQIAWDGNDGEFSSPDVGAAPPDNAALSATAFGSSELDFGGIHLISHINNGLYGNAQSWISDRGVGAGTDTNLFVGLNFGSAIPVRNIAWGRDNGDAVERAEAFTDRAIGTYTLQVTTTADPGVDTTETGDAATGWATVGTVQYQGSDAAFHPWLRHRFELAAADGTPIQATGIRIKVSDPGTDIDEVEVNTAAVNPPAELALQIESSGGAIVLRWEAGVLETAPAVNGQWAEVQGAASPKTVSATESARAFYRLRQ